MTDGPAYTLKAIVERRAMLAAERSQRENEWAAFVRSSQAEIADLDAREKMLIAGVDVARIDRGRAVLVIYGPMSVVRHGRHSDQDRSAVRTAAVEFAKKDIAAGAMTLRHRYVGVKNFEAFGDQRDDHEYGLGPRYGSIVFSISLSKEARQRLRDGDNLTADEIEDALYLLVTLPTIEAANLRAA